MIPKEGKDIEPTFGIYVFSKVAAAGKVLTSALRTGPNLIPRVPSGQSRAHFLQGDTRLYIQLSWAIWGFPVAASARYRSLTAYLGSNAVCPLA